MEDQHSKTLGETETSRRAPHLSVRRPDDAMAELEDVLDSHLARVMNTEPALSPWVLGGELS